MIREKKRETEGVNERYREKEKEGESCIEN